MRAPVRVALLGCGRIARYFHLPILSSHRAFDLVAVADHAPAALANAASVAPTARTEVGVDAVLDRDDVEAVVVCLPTESHADTAVAAFEAGKHVYVEKPLAVDLDGARRVVAAQRIAGRVGAVGFNFRYHPLYRTLRQYLAAGAAGEILAVRTTFCAFPRQLPDWKRRRATGGGALLDLASHHVDLLRFLLDGEIEQVAARVRSVRTEDDTAAVLLTVAGGLPVDLLVSTSGVQQDRVEVHGDRAELLADRYRHARPVVTSARGNGRLARVRDAAALLGPLPRVLRGTVAPRPDPSFAAALVGFADAVRRGSRLEADVVDGARSLAAVVAAERSSTTGRLETPEPVDGGK